MRVMMRETIRARNTIAMVTAPGAKGGSTSAISYSRYASISSYHQR